MKALVPSLTLLLALLPGVASPQWNQLGQDIDGQAVEEKSGVSVALSADGSRVAIGAPDDVSSNSAGLVRIYGWDSAVGAWVQLGSEIESLDPGSNLGESVALSADGSRVAIGIPGTSPAGQVRVFDWIDPNWVQVGPFGIPGEASGDHSGMSVSLSADGSQVAIGATQNGDNGSDSGHVRVYRWISPDWVQRGSDIDGEAAGDESGSSVSLSADGSRVAIGAIYADGINGILTGNVRVYQYNGYPIRDWLQVGQDIDGEAVNDMSGWSVSLSADGSRVAIGARQNMGNNNMTGLGHVRVYRWLSPNWVQVGQDIDGEAAGENSGYSVALSADGFRVAIGSPTSDENGDLSGQVRAYQYRGYPIEDWLQVGEDIGGEAAGDRSGLSVALSSDGTRVAIGAPYNQGNGSSSGHVRVYSTEEIFADGFESGDTSAW